MEQITSSSLGEQILIAECPKKSLQPVEANRNSKSGPQTEPLLTKNAVEFLLNGTLKKKVCKYCLNLSSELSEVDQILQVADKGTMYKVSVMDMIAAFHPFQGPKDNNLPSKICNKCLNRTISAYLFTQQCERAERAIQNCFNDIYEKFEKLDPLIPHRKQGRKKLRINHNVLQVSHAKVINYAEPIIHLVNKGSALLNNCQNPVISELECLKCWQVLPDLPSLVRHKKTHPNTMWIHCRLCGNSFAKLLHWKKHMKSCHSTISMNAATSANEELNTKFNCKECGAINENYLVHLQHLEKHKFKKVLDQLLAKETDDLCTVCLDKGHIMVDLDETVVLHGGCAELNGDRSLYSILGSTLPDMNFLHNYTGRKICKKCMDRAIDAFVFINQSLHNRRRLTTCVSSMLDSLNQVTKVESESSLFVEVADSLILPLNDMDVFDETFVDDDVNESQLKIDVLEDEFRIKSSSDTEDEKKEEIDIKLLNEIDDIGRLKCNLLEELFKDLPKNAVDSKPLKDFDEFNNPAKQVTKTYNKKKVHNGFQSNYRQQYRPIDDVCSEFLTFNKRPKISKKVQRFRFTCPLCSKHFISDYFLSKHILKHVHKKVNCSVCDRVFKSSFLLHEHMKIMHLTENSSCCTCKICGRTFLRNSKLLTHEKTHVKKKCFICDKMFNSQTLFNSHMQRHAIKFTIFSRKIILNCSFCEKECPNKNKLSLHVNKYHLQIKPFFCEMCDRQFYTHSNLVNHKKVHSILSKEKCEFCDKTLKCRRALVEHVREHMNAKSHACFLCGEAFYSEGSRNKHMRNQHGGRFICQLCNNVFPTKNQLKEHARSHIPVF